MYIVTGGAGFIGSRIVAGLNVIGITNILVVDQLETSNKWQNLVPMTYSDYSNKNQFLGDLIRGEYDTKSVKAIFHMGACSSTTETDSDFLMENNYTYTKHLAEWCVERGIRFIYASSAATYGSGDQGYSDKTDLAKLKPLNAYGFSKLAFDRYAQVRGILNRIVGVKFFNVYGANEYHKEDMRSVVHKAFEQIQDGEVVKLFKSHRTDYKNGEQQRDFVYVEDCVKVLLCFLKNTEINGIFNLGTGTARSFKDLVKAVYFALDKKPEIQYIDMPEYLQSKYQYFTQAEMDKLKNTGYKGNFCSLEDGVKDYVQNYLLKR